jgi:hypothetical protein
MSRSTRSKYEFHQEASLSQQLSNQIVEFRKLAGCDTDLSVAIACLEVFIKHGMLDGKDPGVKLLMNLLDAQRMAKFATSETVHEITKMGLMMPKSREEFGKEDEDDSEE